MVAAGVPRERADHALALVQLALDMRDAVASRTFGGETLAFRIGVNSGPVVAGVIGRKKFIYDLWGATVNLASRMESHGQSGTIQITRSTYDLVGAEFDCESAGTIPVKGAGEVDVWRVVGRKGGPPHSGDLILRSPQSGRLEGWSSPCRLLLSVLRGRFAAPRDEVRGLRPVNSPQPQLGSTGSVTEVSRSQPSFSSTSCSIATSALLASSGGKRLVERRPAAIDLVGEHELACLVVELQIDILAKVSERDLASEPPRQDARLLFAQSSNARSWVRPRSSVIASYSVRPGDLHRSRSRRCCRETR